MRPLQRQICGMRPGLGQGLHGREKIVLYGCRTLPAESLIYQRTITSIHRLVEANTHLGNMGCQKCGDEQEGYRRLRAATISIQSESVVSDCWCQIPQ